MATTQHSTWITWLRSLTVAFGILTIFVFFATVPGRPIDTLRLVAPKPTATSSLRVSITATSSDCVTPGTCANLPLAGASVRLFRELGKRYALVSERASDDEGHAQFDELGPGLYWVLAEAKDYARSSATLFLESTPRRLSMRLIPAARLGVTVLDDQRQPVERATVLVRAGDPLPYAGLTTAQGELVFERLPPPPWSIAVHAKGFESFERRGVERDLEVVLRHLSELEVRVLGVDGEPAANAEVSITGTLLFPPHRVTANEAGVARIKGPTLGSLGNAQRSV